MIFFECSYLAPLGLQFFKWNSLKYFLCKWALRVNDFGKNAVMFPKYDQSCSKTNKYEVLAEFEVTNTF